MTQPSGFLIVGSGSIAIQHGRILRKLRGPKFPLTVVSRTSERLAAFKSAVGGLIQAQPEHLFDDQQAFSAAIIASPPATHLNWLQRLAPKTSAILLEKPAVSNPAEIVDVDTCLQQHPNLRLMIAENYDFKPSLDALQRIIAEKKLGALKKVSLRKESRPKPVDWKTECGTLFEGGIHFVALGNSLAGSTPRCESLEILDWRKNSDGVERGSRIRWRCGNEVDVELAYAWDRYSPTIGLGQLSVLTFERGVVRFESNGLWISAGGFMLNDISGATTMMENFLQLHDDSSVRNFRSGWEKSKQDLELVFAAYALAGSKPLTAVMPPERLSFKGADQ